MANITDIQNLLHDTRQEIVQNPENWKSFLKTASRLSKYWLTDQILIHAQRPGTIAAASYDIWGKVGCHVERGSKGIALLTADNKRVHYVFSIDDAAPNTDKDKLPAIWELTDDKKEYVISQLEKVYGETDPTSSYDTNIVDLVQRAADDFINTRLEADQRKTAGEFFKNSVTVAAMYRCGINPDTYWDTFDFSGLPEIMTSEKSFEVLNIGFQETLRPFLEAVGKAVFKYDRAEHVKEEKEKSHDSEHNRVRDEERRTDVSDTPEQGRDNGTHREVRADEAGLPSGEPVGDVPGLNGERGASETSDRDTGDVRREDAGADSGHEEDRENTESSIYGESESGEQYTAESGRDSSERDNISEPVPGSGISELRLNEEIYLNRVNNLFKTSSASLDDKVRFINFLTDKVREDETAAAQITNPTNDKNVILDAGRIDQIISHAVLSMPSADFSNLPWTFTYRPQTKEVAGLIYDLIKKDSPIVNPDISVGAWYRNAYPDDELGALVSDASFRDVINAINRGEDIYELIGCSDSVVRENIFHELEDSFGISYTDTYGKWVSPEENKAISFPGETIPSDIPVSREGNTISIGENPTRELDITVSDEEFREIEQAVPETPTVTADDVEVIRYAYTAEREDGLANIHQFYVNIKGFVNDEFGSEHNELNYTIDRTGATENISMKLRAGDLDALMSKEEQEMLKEKLYDAALLGEQLQKIELRADTAEKLAEVRKNLPDFFPDRLMEAFNKAYAEKEPLVQPRDITDEDIEKVLLDGPHVEHAKFRIYEFFNGQHTAKEKADFLRDEYGMGGVSPVFKGVSSSEMHDAKGIKIELFDKERLITYSDAAKRIGELISADKYLSSDEKKEFEEYKAEQEKEDFEKERDLWYKLYLSVNDDNELHADNSFFNNHYQNAQEIHDANVSTVIQALHSTVTEEQIKEIDYRLAYYVEEGKKRIADLNREEAEQKPEPFAEYGNYYNLADGNVLHAAHLSDDPEYNIEYRILSREGETVDHDLVFVQEPITSERVMDAISKHDGSIHFEGKAVYGVDFADADTLSADDMQEIRELLSTSEYSITESRPNEENTDLGEETVTETASELKSVEPKTKNGRNIIPRNAVEMDVVARIDTMAMKKGEKGVIRKEEDGWILTTPSGERFTEFISNIRNGFAYEITGMRVSDDSISENTEELTFTVAESGEFHNIGMYRQGVRSIEEAKALFNGIPEERRNMIPSIGIRLQNAKDGQINEVQWDILRSNAIDLESLEHVPDIRDNPAAVSMIKEIIGAFPEAVVTGTLPGAEREKEGVLPETGDEAPTAETVETADVSASIPEEEYAGNFHITDDNLGVGTPKQKFQDNLDAINTLKTLEREDRPATLEEQKILSKYVGWGGLADAFDEGKTSWITEYNALKDALTDEEYKAARSSTLNAHYTSPVIIRAMYEKLSDMGVTEGNILEPALGIGNFFGMIPENMQNSGLYGVELDPITGRIAQKLYPEADITVSGFEKTHFPDNSFDVAIGNVPFGDYSVNDPDFKEKGFLIHDYFFAKALDKVKPGGVVAFITSSGTMDKKTTNVREYLAKRADLLGAVRLPNTAFKANAGTEVTADILFLQKRDTVNNDRPAWVDLGETDDGIPVNNYFADRPDMILGTMKEVSGPFGMTYTCEPDESTTLAEQLKSALSRIDGSIDAIDVDVLDPVTISSGVEENDIPNYTFYMKDDKLLFKNGNGVSEPSDLTGTRLERVTGLIPIRDAVKNLLAMQLDPNISEITITSARNRLNSLYDAYVTKYGIINSRGNDLAFRSDASYPLICSLEIFDDEGEFERKADIFTTRTVEPAKTVDHAETSVDALAVSLNDRGRVDIPYMAELTGFDADKVISDLENLIYKDPVNGEYVTADAYLSGDIREKVRIAQEHIDNGEAEYAGNIEKLNEVMPEWLGIQDISVSLGATWFPTDMVQDFMEETFSTPENLKDSVRVEYSGYTGQWDISEPRRDQSAISTATYGTTRKTAYELLEATLNARNVKVYDADRQGNRVVNRNETMLAQQKQQAIKEAFRIWVYSDPDRRRTLEELYNNKFNSIRPRQYDGSHLTFPGMSSAIELKPHQKDAVAHILYGDSTLLAHVVGAGKTYEMAAGAMESKRLGFCNKALVVVPDHLTEQEGGDFARLYPGANILVAQKKDFEAKNRKQFCARIATGNYDVIIMGHSQFNKIPLSKERQIADTQMQIDEITDALSDVKKENKSSFSVKQMEKTKKKLEAKIDSLNKIKQDNVITFEELGIDKLFIDESHYFKNLYTYTKMSNIAGVQTSDSQKAADMYSKTRYINEITGGKGVVFATGTPVANSMTELYTNMRYLMPERLRENGFGLFDSWASVFGEVVTAVELAPEGNKFRQKSRFAKFHNVPELISMFKECADIKTADMLNLPVPEAEYIDVTLEPSDEQKAIVEELGQRAERIRNGQVQSTEDNMLKVTSDGRKAALDQRLFDGSLGDDPNSKVNACVDNVYDIWNDTKEQKSAQMIFCDMSTPKAAGKDGKNYQEWGGDYDVYNDIKSKLIDKGVPADEIAFVHDATDDKKKAELFAKVRAGKVRVLIGSTQKMGAGTNVQKRLIALHHMDAPWRPADIEQREGRIIRQGNGNEKVKIFRYLKTGTFDAYMWQTLRNKQRYISQIMTSKTPDRSCDELDYLTLSYAEVTAQCAGNPLIKEKIELENAIQQLNVSKSGHLANKFRLEDDISIKLPGLIKRYETAIAENTKDIATYDVEKAKSEDMAKKHAEDRARTEREEKNRKAVEKGKEPDNSPLNINVKSSDSFRVEIGGKEYTDAISASEALVNQISLYGIGEKADKKIGSFMGFDLMLAKAYSPGEYTLIAKGEGKHSVNFDSLTTKRVFASLSKKLSEMQVLTESMKESLETAKTNLETAKNEVNKPFEHEQELNDKIKRLAEVDAELGVGNDQNEGNDLMDEEQEAEKPDVSLYTKIGKTKDGGFSVNVKPYELIFEINGIDKKETFDTLEDAEKARTETDNRIAEIIEEDAKPETPEKLKEDIHNVSTTMTIKNRRSLPHEMTEYLLNKTYDMVENLKADPETVDIGEALEEKLKSDKTFSQYAKKDGVWHHRNYALGTPECREAEKNRYSYYASSDFYHTLNTYNFRTVVNDTLANAIADGVAKNPDKYDNREDLLTIFAQKKFEDFRKKLQTNDSLPFMAYYSANHMRDTDISLEVKDGKLSFNITAPYDLESKIFDITPLEYEADYRAEGMEKALEGLYKHAEEIAHIEAICTGQLKGRYEDFYEEIKGVMPKVTATMQEAVECPDKYTTDDLRNIHQCAAFMADKIFDIRYDYRADKTLKEAVTGLYDDLQNGGGVENHPILSKYRSSEATTETIKTDLEDLKALMDVSEKALHPENRMEKPVAPKDMTGVIGYLHDSIKRSRAEKDAVVIIEIVKEDGSKDRINLSLESLDTSINKAAENNSTHIIEPVWYNDMGRASTTPITIDDISAIYVGDSVLYSKIMFDTRNEMTMTGNTR